MLNIYLDQNILGLIADGRLRIRENQPITWLYSDEHMNEIARGQKTDLLEVLANLRAQRLVVKRDAGLITDSWAIFKYECPHDVYAEVRNNDQSAVEESAPFTGLIAAIFGAQDPALRESYPDAVASKIERNLVASGLMAEMRINRIVDQIRDASASAIRRMGQPITLEGRRKPLVLDKGRASAFERSDNPIGAIWDHIKEGAPDGMTADRFFGFDPAEKKLFGYTKWPEFLGMVMCYHVLNTIGFAPDKGMAKPARVPANLSDACHVAYAGFTDGIISADTRLCKKAKAIYKFKGIAVGVNDVNDRVILRP